MCACPSGPHPSCHGRGPDPTREGGVRPSHRLRSSTHAGGPIDGASGARNGIGVSEAAQDLITQISIRVIQSDGTTVRGTALALQTHATSSGLAKWAAQNPPDNRVFPPQGATALAAVAGAVAGDYLVVELGYRNFTVEAVTGGAIYLYDSSTAGDLPEGNSSTAVLNSWIEICA